MEMGDGPKNKTDVTGSPKETQDQAVDAAVKKQRELMLCDGQVSCDGEADASRQLIQQISEVVMNSSIERAFPRRRDIPLGVTGGGGAKARIAEDGEIDKYLRVRSQVEAKYNAFVEDLRKKCPDEIPTAESFKISHREVIYGSFSVKSFPFEIVTLHATLVESLSALTIFAKINGIELPAKDSHEELPKAIGELVDKGRVNNVLMTTLKSAGVANVVLIVTAMLTYLKQMQHYITQSFERPIVDLLSELLLAVEENPEQTTALLVDYVAQAKPLYEKLEEADNNGITAMLRPLVGEAVLASEALAFEVENDSARWFYGELYNSLAFPLVTMPEPIFEPVDEQAQKAYVIRNLMGYSSADLDIKFKRLEEGLLASGFTAEQAAEYNIEAIRNRLYPFYKFIFGRRSGMYDEQSISTFAAEKLIFEPEILDSTEEDYGNYMETFNTHVSYVAGYINEKKDDLGYEMLMAYVRLSLHPSAIAIDCERPHGSISETIVLIKTPLEVMQVAIELQDAQWELDLQPNDRKRFFVTDFIGASLVELEQAGALDGYRDFFIDQVDSAKESSKRKKGFKSVSANFLASENEMESFTEFGSNVDIYLKFLENKKIFNKRAVYERVILQLIENEQNLPVLNSILLLEDADLQVKMLDMFDRFDDSKKGKIVKFCEIVGEDQYKFFKLCSLLVSNQYDAQMKEFLMLLESDEQLQYWDMAYAFLLRYPLNTWEEFCSHQYRHSRGVVDEFIAKAELDEEDMPATVDELLQHPDRFKLIGSLKSVMNDIKAEKARIGQYEDFAGENRDPAAWGRLMEFTDVAKYPGGINFQKLEKDYAFLDDEERVDAIDLLGKVPIRGFGSFMKKGLHILVSGMSRHDRAEELLSAFEQLPEGANLAAVIEMVEDVCQDLPAYLHSLKLLAANEKFIQGLGSRFEEIFADIFFPSGIENAEEADNLEESQNIGMVILDALKEEILDGIIQRHLLRALENGQVLLAHKAVIWKKRGIAEDKICQLLKTYTDEEVEMFTNKELLNSLED